MAFDWRPLCHIDEIGEGNAKGFDAEQSDLNGQLIGANLFVVRKDGEFSAYKNSCPHLGVRLDWQPDQFLDLDGYFIQCSAHGALFNVGDGMCVSGPCMGIPLTPIPFRIEKDTIQISISVDEG